jgi:glycosyltransferase involved in cell wall biosynthesis
MLLERAQAAPQQLSAAIADDDDMEVGLRRTQRNRQDTRRESVAREVLVVTRDRVGPEMAGPAIRAVELARVLAEEHSVRLAAPFGEQVDSQIRFFRYDRSRAATLRDALDGVEVVFSDPLPPAVARAIPDGRRRWIVDFYNPEPFEGLETYRQAKGKLERRALDVVRTDRLLFAAQIGSAFVCANERQRDMWLGFLAAERRVASTRYDADPEGWNLVEIVPFGVPSEPPQPGAALLRGKVFPEDARILVWSGGLWDWLDPLTVLRALARLREEDDRWGCAFIGTVRPFGGEHFTMVERTTSLAEELGLSRSGAVHFIDWIPYAERGVPLLEADAAVCAHFRTMETRFAVRTRLSDAVWAGLPIINTDGDHWSELIRSRGLGEVIPPEQPEQLAAAAERVVEKGRGHYEASLRSTAAELRWPVVAKPLRRLVDQADRLPPAAAVPLGARVMGARHAGAQRAHRIRTWLGRG